MAKPEQSASEAAPTPAAQYLRVSTDIQRYSSQHQRAAIKEFSQREGYSVVRTYLDEGKSGMARIVRCGSSRWAAA